MIYLLFGLLAAGLAYALSRSVVGTVVNGILGTIFAWFVMPTLAFGFWDSTLLVTVFVILGLQSLIPLWLVVVAVLRDLIIFSGALIYRQLYRNIDPEPRLLSKLNTLVQILLAVMVLIHAWLGWFSDSMILIAVWVVTTTVIISGIDYVVIWLQRARRAARS